MQHIDGFGQSRQGDDAKGAGLVPNPYRLHAQVGDLAHIDATLKLFAPEIDLRTLRPKEHRRRNVYFRSGEMPLFILDTLRQASMPLTTPTIAAKGLESTPETLTSIQKSLLCPASITLAEGSNDGSVRTVQICSVLCVASF